MELEVMHFILLVRLWFLQGFHVNPTSLHGYSLCCRISNLNQTDDESSDSGNQLPPNNPPTNAPNTDTDTDTSHPQTR